MVTFRDAINTWKTWVNTWGRFNIRQSVCEKGLELSQRVEELFKEEYKLSSISEADEDMELLPKARIAYYQLLEFISKNSVNKKEGLDGHN